MIEEFKDISGYEGLYQVSNLGIIKSLARYVRNGENSKMLRPEKFPVLKKLKSGYFQVCLHKNNKPEYIYIHRLVAQTFLLNPENKRTVNHKNGVKSCNTILNLEWCTHKENSIHAFANGLYEKATRQASYRGKKLIGDKNKNSKPVLNLETGVYYSCIKEASDCQGYNTSTLQQKLTGKILNNTSLILV